MSCLWIAYVNCRLAMSSGQVTSNLTEVTDNLFIEDDRSGNRPGESSAHFLPNYQSYRFAAWYKAE